MHVRAASEADLGWVEETARALLGDPFQAHSRRQFHVTDAEVLVAEVDGEPAGFLSWEVDGAWCEVLAIGCTASRVGAGTALMAAVATAAAEGGCRRIAGRHDRREHGRAALLRTARLRAGGADRRRRRRVPPPVQADDPRGHPRRLRYERDL